MALTITISSPLNGATLPNNNPFIVSGSVHATAATNFKVVIWTSYGATQSGQFWESGQYPIGAGATVNWAVTDVQGPAGVAANFFSIVASALDVGNSPPVTHITKARYPGF